MQNQNSKLKTKLRVYNKTESDFNKRVWITAFAGMTEDDRKFCYKIALLKT